MTNFIPIFPLSIIVFPGEELNLHIFEPRYKQLINECFAEKKPFGIPAMVNDKLMDFGALVNIVEIKHIYPDGKMDIRTMGGNVFRLLELVVDLPEKLYNGAIVNYPENEQETKPALFSQVLNSIKDLHGQLNISKNFNKPEEEMLSYDVAHHAGLSLVEEYDLLQLFREDQRLEYLRRHLNKVLPIIKEMEGLKQRVQLNGHFRELKGLGL